MNGRSQRKPRARALAGVLLTALLACGGEPTSGPVEPAWDRDTCEHCRMTLGDRRHAAQIRLESDSRVRHFDDLGCALLWLEEQRSAGDGAREFFVRDIEGDAWLSAEGARYRTGQRTPMGYGFGAVRDGGADTLTLGQVLEAVTEREVGRHPAH